MFPDGYHALIDGMLKETDLSTDPPKDALINHVHLNAVVTAITTSDTDITVTYDSPAGTGLVKKADAVIVTVPAGVLRSGLITFTPSLSTTKQTALEVRCLGRPYMRLLQHSPSPLTLTSSKPRLRSRLDPFVPLCRHS